MGVQMFFRGGVTIKNLLMAPKDQDPMLKKSGVIYRYKCDRVECDEEYMGQSSRTFGERFKEHQKAPSLIYDHYNIFGHMINTDNFSIVGREDQNLMRTIKEALYIRVNNPSLNRNIGKYNLPHIWDEVLYNTSELKIDIKKIDPHGNSICQLGHNIYQAPSPTLSGNSICHLAITPAIPNK